MKTRTAIFVTLLTVLISSALGLFVSVLLFKTNTENISASLQEDTQVKETDPSKLDYVNDTKDLKELSTEELAQLKSNIVVVLSGESLGSGVIYDTTGLVLTNYHVIEDNLNDCYIMFQEDYESENYGNKIFARILKFDKDKDLALLKIEKSVDKPIRFGDFNKLKQGQKIISIGNPKGLVNTVSDGIISAIRNIDGLNLIQFTAPITFGNSGGALFNVYGELIGITSFGYGKEGNLNFAISIKDIEDFLNNMTISNKDTNYLAKKYSELYSNKVAYTRINGDSIGDGGYGEIDVIKYQDYIMEFCLPQDFVFDPKEDCIEFFYSNDNYSGTSVRITHTLNNIDKNKKLNRLINSLEQKGYSVYGVDKNGFWLGDKTFDGFIIRAKKYDLDYYALNYYVCYYKDYIIQIEIDSRSYKGDKSNLWGYGLSDGGAANFILATFKFKV